MSADLLAEFAQQEWSAGKDDERLCEPNNMPLQDSGALISVTDDCSHAAPAVKEGIRPEKIWQKGDNGEEVLFDATIDQDDDFGDFEDGDHQEAAHGQFANLLDEASPEKDGVTHVQCLLDLQSNNDRPRPSQANESHYGEDEWGDFSTAISKEQSEQRHSGVSMGTSNHGGAPLVDKTGKGADLQPLKDGEAANLAHYNHPAGLLPTCDIDVPASQSKSPLRNSCSTKKGPAASLTDESRPSNIPPPAILFQILPKIFLHVAQLSNPQDFKQYSGTILQVYTVASHLIAGRRLRWKRDIVLSQSTKIGPAAAGGKGGGMKLAPIDKGENLKEEREVAGVVEAWERHAHLFNSSVHKVGIRRPFMALSAKMTPRPAKGAGILLSQRACALCGIKRDERVPEVDIDVDDLFGDFWIEHWGHRNCRDFWHMNKALLTQR